MKIKPFKVEEWMNAYEVGAKYNIAETCVDSVSVDELFELVGQDKEAFLRDLCSRRMTYGDIFGQPAFKEGVCSLYKTIAPDQVVTTHGAAGANHHVYYSLVEPGDHVISVIPTYQQLYSIPESMGAEVELLHLEKENGYLPDLEKLRAMVRPNTKIIAINNPNNPTGALMGADMLNAICDIARSVGAYVLCDEVYRHLTTNPQWSASVADLYEKGISTGSMSKVFSLAGLRQGWIASRDKDFIEACLSHRDYNHISCSMFDEAVAAVALQGKDKLLARNVEIIRENLEILADWVEQQPHISWVKPQAGTTALLYYDLDRDSYTFCKKMYDACGAFVTPGDCFEEPKSMRIGYACDKQELIEGLRAMGDFIKSLEEK